MFCYQCEQTARGKGCTAGGVCGKPPEVAALQDLLIHGLKGISILAMEGRKVGVNDREVNVFTLEALFSTLTNVNFDPDRFVAQINRCIALRDRLKEKVAKAGGKTGASEDCITFKPEGALDALVRQGARLEKKVPDPALNPDIQSLQDIVLFGLKGVAAYADHAQILGKEDDAVYSCVHEALASMTRKDLSADDWTALVFKCGATNLKAMELLDAGNTETYGHPVPTKVPLGAKKGKAILVSGHDLRDLEEILKQTAGKGIFVYTHGEMLPTHGYPALKKHPHFYGHYGTAWQNQQREFPLFPGAIVMTTNCIQKPLDSYKANIFTRGVVGWPGVSHLLDRNFAPAIERALQLPGFTADVEGKTVTVGFARNAVLGVAGKIVEAVKNKKIRHFFLVGGCDGAKGARSYYADFVAKVPKDCIVLTLACGKFRFFDKELGDIEGIPRLIDIGQCNDAYSAIQIAVALSKAFKVGVNELPLSLILSWYEQKAVAILLALLSLGIKNIRIGPSLPAFITPNVLNVLVEKFKITPISTPDADLKAILG